MIAASRLMDANAALAQLFPPGVAVSVVAIGAEGPPLFPEEAEAVSGAVPSRIAEFVAGRQAARRAMAALGYASAPISAGRDRAPVWPEGLSGSISHAEGIAAAAVRAGAPLGLDLEADAELEVDLWPLICNPAELEALPIAYRGLAVRQAFAAKEAVYKAQYPLTGQLIGFDAVSITFRGADFIAGFLQDVGPLPRGHEMHGRMTRTGGLILAGVAT